MEDYRKWEPRWTKRLNIDPNDRVYIPVIPPLPGRDHRYTKHFEAGVLIPEPEDEDEVGFGPYEPEAQ